MIMREEPASVITEGASRTNSRVRATSKTMVQKEDDTVVTATGKDGTNKRRNIAVTTITTTIRIEVSKAESDSDWESHCDS